MTTQDPVDIATLEMLREVMEDNFTELLDTYLTDCNSRFEALAAALAAGDSDVVRREAHSLKGSSSNLGAAPLADLCYAMEQRGREANLEGGETLLADMNAEFQRVSTQLRAMLS